MSIELSDDLEKYAREQIASGAYADTDALLRAALREKMIAEQVNAEEIEALRAEIEVGWQQAERGECRPLDMAELKRELATERDG
jgi:putative addiction module CopG family antidote